MFDKLGRYTGFPFVAGRTPSGPITAGSLYWNNNAMNKTDNFDITTSKFTTDGNDIERILNLCSVGSIIHFKDFAGRSTTLEFVGYINTDDVLTITVKGFSENTDYNYQIGEFEPCMIEIISESNKTTDIEQDFENNTIGTTSKAVFDFVENNIENAKNFTSRILFSLSNHIPPASNHFQFSLFNIGG